MKMMLTCMYQSKANIHRYIENKNNRNQIKIQT